MTNYIYLLHGTKEIFYTEAAYSIATLLKHIDHRSSRVIVFTDRPEKLRTWPVLCHSIASDLSAMKGPAGFVHRVKICALARCLDSYSGNAVYLDADTFIRGSQARLTKMVERIAEDTAVMYHHEFNMHRKRFQDPYAKLANFEMPLADGRSYSFGANSWMHNAGVVGIHESHRGLLDITLKLCDEFLRLFGRVVHISEQLAFSEIFRTLNINVVPAEGPIIHYYRSSRRSYMREKLAQRNGEASWDSDNLIPYSAPRLTLFKLLNSRNR